MIVGSNERLYAWMDEGFNTFMNYYDWEKKYPGTYNRRGKSQALHSRLPSQDKEDPVMTPADRINGRSEPYGLHQAGSGAGSAARSYHWPEPLRPSLPAVHIPWAYKHPNAGRFLPQHRGRGR